MNTAFVAVLLPMLLVLGGVAIDGGQLFVERRQTQALADAAARAGAAELDELAARTNPLAPAVLSPDRAAAAATTFVGEVQPAAAIVVSEVDPQHIRVRVTSPPVKLTLLQLIPGLQTIRVQASGQAEPRTGITRPGE